MNGWKRMLWTLGLVAVWYLIVTLAAKGFDVFSMSVADWKLVLIAILAGIGGVATNWLAPWIKQYGISKE